MEAFNESPPFPEASSISFSVIEDKIIDQAGFFENTQALFYKEERSLKYHPLLHQSQRFNQLYDGQTELLSTI